MSSLRTATQRWCISTILSSRHTLAPRTSVLQNKSRGIHNVSLPMLSEDTIYTRSSHAFSRAQKRAQKEISTLEREIKDKDAMIQRLGIELLQKRGVIQQLERFGQGVGTGRVRGGEEVKLKVKRADRMMELLGQREKREGSDPL